MHASPRGVTRPEEDYARTPLAAWREDCMPLPIPWPIPDYSERSVSKFDFKQGSTIALYYRESWCQCVAAGTCRRVVDCRVRCVIPQRPKRG
jgi:hypothetical protein